MDLSVNGISPTDIVVSAQDDGSQTAQAERTFHAMLDEHAQQNAAPKTNDQVGRNHGIDDIQAGFRQAWSGKPTDNYTQQAATGAVFS